MSKISSNKPKFSNYIKTTVVDRAVDILTADAGQDEQGSKKNRDQFLDIITLLEAFFEKKITVSQLKLELIAIGYSSNKVEAFLATIKIIE